LSRARGVHGAAPRSVPITAARCWVGPRVAWVESGVPMDLQGWSKIFGYLFLSHCQTGLSQWLWKFLDWPGDNSQEVGSCRVSNHPIVEDVPASPWQPWHQTLSWLILSWWT
jgi:hypothetical protein